MRRLKRAYRFVCRLVVLLVTAPWVLLFLGLCLLIVDFERFLAGDDDGF